MHMFLFFDNIFRYQYDPNSSLKRSMTSIWSVLVKDEKNMVCDFIIDKHVTQTVFNIHYLSFQTIASLKRPATTSSRPVVKLLGIIMT